jgi:hypothetical protein
MHQGAFYTSAVDGVFALTERAMRLCRDDPDQTRVFHLWKMRFVMYRHRGDVVLARRAEANARSATRGNRELLLILKNQTILAQGRWDGVTDAIRDATSLVAAAKDFGDEESVNKRQVARGSLLVAAGRLEEAEDSFDQSSNVRSVVAGCSRELALARLNWLRGGEHLDKAVEHAKLLQNRAESSHLWWHTKRAAALLAKIQPSIVLSFSHPSFPSSHAGWNSRPISLDSWRYSMMTS